MRQVFLVISGIAEGPAGSLQSDRPWFSDGLGLCAGLGAGLGAGTGLGNTGGLHPAGHRKAAAPPGRT